MGNVIDHWSEQDEVLVCHDDKDTYQMIEAQKGHLTTTGLPFLEVFEKKDDAKNIHGAKIDAYELKFVEVLEDGNSERD